MKKLNASRPTNNPVRTLFGFFGLLILLSRTGLAGFAAARRYRYLKVGGVSNVWKGAGLGTVHSSPSAPSHGLSAAFLPPLIDGMITKNRK
jgi:hypothetical protein